MSARRHCAFCTRLVSSHSHPRGYEFTPFTDEDTEALSGQETCPNDGGGSCAHHGDEDSIGFPASPLVPWETMRMPGEFDGEAQAMWEPEEDSNQPGVSGAPRGVAVCSGV